MRRTSLALAAVALSVLLSGCGTTYVEHRFTGDARSALAMERLIAKIPLDCPSGASVRDANIRSQYQVDTDEARRPERSEVRGRTLRACVQ